MTPLQLLLLFGGGYLLYRLYATNQLNCSTLSCLSNAFECGWTQLQGAIMNWASVNEGPTWVPVINQTETALGIPTNLLARMAYQESSFQSDVIDGTHPSCEGALGILQLEPAYFSSVEVATPFTAADTTAQIQQAGQYLVQLYNQFGDWGDAVAAYNAGPGTISGVLAGSATLPAQTSTYVTDVLTDVPVESISCVPALKA